MISEARVIFSTHSYLNFGLFSPSWDIIQMVNVTRTRLTAHNNPCEENLNLL